MDSQVETIEQNQQSHGNPKPDSSEGTYEWETMARAWLSTLPRDKSLNPTDVETWLQSNYSSLPDHIKSMPPSHVYEIVIKFRDDIAPSNEEKDPYHARFQRTDQWMPIYSWLESLKTDEVIKSKEILEWLTENPEVRDDLYARHSRYHLMHYIKKCHMKILKRKEKPTNKTSSPRVHKIEEKKLPLALPCNSVTKLPKDSPVYLVKRNEAFRKYEILIEMEKQLAAIIPKQGAANV